MNRVFLLGNVGDDPQTKKLDGDNQVSNLSLATSDTYKDKEGEKKTDTIWHRLVAWGKTSGVIEKYVKKGDRILVEGKVVNRSYEDKDGNKKYVSEVIVERMEMLGGSKKKEETKDETPAEAEA